MKSKLLSSDDIAQVKLIEREMLLEYIHVCEKLSLRYYIIGGTLLGAVRHRGFIPWDDDIDVAMPRKDYEVFMKKAMAILPNYYFVQNNSSDPEYPSSIMKLRDSRTTFIEYTVQKFNMNHGVFIDIFPLDYYPENSLARTIEFFKGRLIHFRLRKEYSIDETIYNNKIKEIVLCLIGLIMKIVYPTITDALIAENRTIYRKRKSKWIGNKLGNALKKERVPITWFSNSVPLEFEGIKVMAPKEYKKYLRHIYGDYMQLPPKEKQVAHHYVKEIDLNKPQEKYYK